MPQEVSNCSAQQNERSCAIKENRFNLVKNSHVAALEKALSEIKIHGNRTDEDIAKLRYMDREENDLSGKRVVLFCSHGTCGLASSVKDISVALPNSTVESNAIGVYRDDIPKSRDTVKKLLNEIGF